MKAARFIAGTLFFLLVPMLGPSKVVRFIAGIRFFVLIPVIGLAIAASVLFIKGGIDIVHLIGGLFTGGAETGPEENIIVHIVEIVHLFLVGTVLFLTSFGLYQLFIQPLPLPEWLKVHNLEEMELNLVGLTIVVLGVNFLSVIFNPQETNLISSGVGYALPIAALAYFMKVRTSMSKNGGEGEHLMSICETTSEDSDLNRLPDKKQD